MYSSTGPDTLHPVERLGESERVELASRSKSRASRLREGSQGLRRGGSLGPPQWLPDY